MSAAAMFSPDRRYRYVLSRGGLRSPVNAARVVFIMLNPSTADAFKLDPTVTRCAGYAERWGYEELIVLNAYALRSTDPRELWTAQDPVGPLNDRAIAGVLELTDKPMLVVCAWGNDGAGRSLRIRRLIAKCGRDAWALAVNASGEPKHPLYVRGALNVSDLVALPAPAGSILRRI